jgi:hypothetical protein
MAFSNHFARLLHRIAEHGADLMRAPRRDREFAPLVYPNGSTYHRLTDSAGVAIRPAAEPTLISPLELVIQVGDHKVTVDSPMRLQLDELYRLSIRGAGYIAEYMDGAVGTDWDDALLSKHCNRMLNGFKRTLKEYRQEWLQLCKRAAVEETQYLPELERFLSLQRHLPRRIHRAAVIAGLKELDHVAYALSTVQQSVEAVLGSRYTVDLNGYYRALDDMRSLSNALSLLVSAEALIAHGLVDKRISRPPGAMIYHGTCVTAVLIIKYEPPFYSVDNAVLVRAGRAVCWKEYEERESGDGDLTWSGLFSDTTFTFRRSILPGIEFMQGLINSSRVIRVEEPFYRIYMSAEI